MDFITTNYKELLQFTASIIRKKRGFLLYNEYDIVHDVIALGDNFRDLNEVKGAILTGIQKGSIIRTGINDKTIINDIWQPLDEKYCSKCKQLRFIIYDFRLKSFVRGGRRLYYYENQCRKCLGGWYSLYTKTDHGSTILKKASKKYKARISDELNDAYIREVIANQKRRWGIKCSISDITPQEVAIKRQEIIAIRAKQINKGRK